MIQLLEEARVIRILHVKLLVEVISIEKVHKSWKWNKSKNSKIGDGYDKFVIFLNL